jgi:protein Hikeshi
MLPGNNLPPDTAAGVHIQLPGSTEFRFLGAIANEKPSAIFKINLRSPKPRPGSNSNEDPENMTDSTPSTLPDPTSTPSHPDQGDINLGISVEPVANIQAQLATLQSQTQRPSLSPNLSQTALIVHRPSPQTKDLAQRIIKDAFNFLASYAGGGGPGGQEVVPLKSFQDWWSKFERRVENDPGFLERETGS